MAKTRIVTVSPNEQLQNLRLNLKWHEARVLKLLEELTTHKNLADKLRATLDEAESKLIDGTLGSEEYGVS